MENETPAEKEIRLAKEKEAKKAIKAEEQRIAKEAEEKAETDRLTLESEAKLAEEAEAARIQQEAKEAEEKAEAERLEAEAKALENTPQTISLKGVVLKGTASQMKGSHTIHFNASTNVSFVDGKANVSEVLSEQLKNAGYIE